KNQATPQAAGNLPEGIKLNFTCTGWSPSMSTSVAISGTNTANGQPLAASVNLPVSGKVKQ
ncbi:MAG: hypothetical protein WCP10_10655, partial [Desulfuromonadales bacterium]